MDKEKVKEVIEKIRPQLQADGGDVEIVEITDDGIVKVRLMGHCAGCPYSQQTLSLGIIVFLLFRSLNLIKGDAVIGLDTQILLSITFPLFLLLVEYIIYSKK